MADSTTTRTRARATGHPPWHAVRFGLTIIAVVGSVSACSQSQTTAAGPSPTTTTHEFTPARVRKHRSPRRNKTHHGSARTQISTSNASSTTVQAQPPPGSCHARGSGLYAEPDPRCTPGALTPAVTQATIDQTICVSGYTRTVRPSESITSVEKQGSMAAYGDSGPRSAYEYDHLVSLELGGAPNDPRNLWPEPGASPNPKDSVENALHRMVCDGEMPLATAQHIIATGWVAWARGHGAQPGTPAPTAPSPAPTPPSPSPAPGPGSGPNKPISEINCSDFPTHAAAQQWFDQHGGSPTNDVAGLDHDHDGLACESLP